MKRCIELALTLLLAMPAIAVAQTGVVTGRVSDATNSQPLQGASVRVVGLGTSVTTNSEGRYRIPFAGDATAKLRITLIGYAPAEVLLSEASATRVLDVTMTRAALGLDEVVVTGSAGPTRVREVGHAIAQIRMARVPEPPASMDNLLAGKVPGLTVLMSAGSAGSGSQVRLRGNTSISLSNQPLIYVDGVRIRSDGYPRNQPFSGDTRRSPGDVPSPLNDIDPMDVERIEIVRGPAATTLYGTEAATGVIQIFTRRGSTGEPVWNAQFQLGADRVQKFGTDAEPFMRLEPWLKTARRTGYSLSTSGGKAARYFLSTSLNRNEGVLPNDFERRLGLRANFDFDLSDRIAVAWSTSYTDNDLRNTAAGPNSQGLTMNAYRGDNNYTGVPGKEAIDRVLDWEIGTALRHFIGGVTAVYAASPRSSHRVTLGHDKAEADMRSLRPFGFVFAPGGILSEEQWKATTFTTDYLGRASFGVLPALGATLSWGAQSVTTDIESFAGYAEGLPGAGVPTISSGAQTQAFQSRSRAVNAGFFSQILFDLRDRIFLTAGLRLDGNSSFGNDFGLQPYPRVNASYVISEEPFWPRGAGTMKLRAAYGHAGRAPRVFDAERSWVQSGYDGQLAYLPKSIGDPLLGPERTAEMEVGFDAGLLRNHLTASFTAYRRNTDNALFPVALAPSLGFLGSQIRNVGSLRSSGIELAIDGQLFAKGNASMDAGLSLATHRSTIVSLGGVPRFSISETAWVEQGQPAPVLRGTLIRNPDAIADPIIETNYRFGPNVPTHTVGARGTLRLPRQIELNARAELVGGNFMFDRASRHLASNGALPQCADVYPLIASGQTGSLTAWERVYCRPASVPEDGPIYPADFIRLRALSLTVPLPGAAFRANEATVVVSARNYLLWKNREFPVFDPEMAGREGMNTIDRYIDLQVPPTAGLSIAIRASYR